MGMVNILRCILLFPFIAMEMVKILYFIAYTCTVVGYNLMEKHFLCDIFL